MSILISIAGEFTGAKAFKKAEKASFSLEKNVKSLGKSLGIALSVGTVVAFGKAAAKAFMDDERAAAQLANTVDNLGLSFANTQITTFIDELSRAAGVTAGELRPAMQTLLTTTGSVANSQKLLNEALEISRGSGVELATVVQDLANAYVGNIKGLKKYNLGLTQAELAAMSFQEIQAKLNKTFSGSSAKYLETYAGKMSLLTTAAGRAQETIGKGLVDALMAISGNTDIQGLISDIDAFAQDLAATLVEVGKLIKPIVDTLKGLIGLLKQGGKIDVNVSPAEQFRRELANRKPLYGPEAVVAGYQNAASQRKAAQDSAKAEAAAAKRAKELAALSKKNLDEQKKQAALKKAGSIFDLQQIQLIAALKGNISDEERKRLELQLALEQGNVEEAKKLTYQLAIAQGLGIKIAQDLASLPKASNPFAAWKGYLDEIELQVKRINSFGGGTPTPSGNVPKMPIASPDMVMAQASADFAAANNTIRLIVEGGDEVTNLMRFKIQEAAQSGSTTNWSQTVGAFDR